MFNAGGNGDLKESSLWNSGETVFGFNKKHEVFLSNWTEWSTIQGLFARIISKMDEREARGRFEITRATTWIQCMTRG